MSTRQNVPANGWHVEIDNANGQTFTPDTLDDPQRQPKANDYPQITIPIRRSEKWMDPTFEKAPLRVWCDGERQPIDTLGTVELTGEKTVLHGRGGDELKQPVQAEYSQKPADEVARELISDYTSYTVNVDAPETTEEDRVLADSATDGSEFSSRFPFSDTDPWVVVGTDANAYVAPYRTCLPKDAVDDNTAATAPAYYSSTDQYSGGQALHFQNAGDYAVFQVHFPYTVPAEHVGIKLFDRIISDSNISYRWNDTGFEQNLGLGKSLGWADISQDSFYSSRGGYASNINRDIEGGEYYWLKIEANDTSDYMLDSLAVYDDRYNYTWPDSDSYGVDQYLPGPEEYPDKLVLTSHELPQSRTITGAEMDATFNTTETVTGGQLRVGWSHTQGEFFRTSLNNQSQVDYHDFLHPGASFEAYFEMSRWGDDPDRQSIPTKGFNTHELHAFDLYADFSDLPLVVNQQYNASLHDVLQEVADVGNFVWEYRRDPDDGSQSIEWTQMGQRESGVTLNPSDYTLEKDFSQPIQAASVYGSSNPHIAPFKATLGTTVPLPNDKIQESSETVRNPRTGQRFQRNTDYSFDYDAGELTPLSDGQMEDNGRYEVEYQYQTYGSFALDGVSNPTELPPRDIAGLTSNSACAQAARIIVSQAKDPRFDATITIPNDRVGWSLAESLDVEGLPTNGRTLHLRGIDHTPSETTLTLGIGQSVSEIIDDITSRVSNVSRHS